jgi:hypothetical protein
MLIIIYILGITLALLGIYLVLEKEKSKNLLGLMVVIIGYTIALISIFFDTDINRNSKRYKLSIKTKTEIINDKIINIDTIYIIKRK